MPRITQTFNGNPCTKCGESLRYVSDSRCVRCRREWAKSPKRQKYLGAYWNNPEHKKKLVAYRRKYYRSYSGRSVMLWHYARTRANGVFTITPKDVEKELMLAEKKWAEIGIEFDYDGCNGRRAYSPSIDQIIPGAGYTPENIQVVPWAWNALRGDSLTNAEALEFCKKVALSGEVV